MVRRFKQAVARLLAAVYRLLAPVVGALERYHGHSVLPLPPAHAYVQHDAVRNLPAYLGTTADEIRRIVIVGAWHGEEVDEMLERFPRCRFVLLEPSRAAFARLSERLAGNARVNALEVAAADSDGTTTFHEMSVTGNGSLLPLAAPGEQTFRTPGIRETDSYEVQTRRLDRLAELAGDDAIDCLWVDVQGLELPVLKGAAGLLDRVRSAFVEVATDKRSYEGATGFVELEAYMAEHGFRLAGLGTDPANGQGNALWVKARAPVRAAAPA